MESQPRVAGFPVTDPRGLIVRCRPANWAVHAARHTEIADRADWVVVAIAQPLAIYRSSSHADRTVYYRRLDVEPDTRLQYLRVVVAEQPGLREGWFVSAFAVREPKKTEVLLWP